MKETCNLKLCAETKETCKYLHLFHGRSIRDQLNWHLQHFTTRRLHFINGFGFFLIMPFQLLFLDLLVFAIAE